MKTNEQVLKDTISTADFINAGYLHPKQQSSFITYVLDYSQLLQQVRTVKMTQTKEEIDSMYLSEPITESAEENTTQGSPNNQGQPKYGKIQLIASKLRSTFDLTHEAMRDGLEKTNFKDHVMRVMTKRIGTDFEMLSIQGDTSAGSATKVARLLNRLDGWMIQSEQAHILDAEGQNINKDIFRLAKRILPQQYRSDPGLRWIMAESVYDDWTDWLAEQKVSDSFIKAIKGKNVAPLGIPIITIPLIPDYMEVDYPTDAQGAQVIGTNYGPWTVVTGQNDAVKITVVAGGTTYNITEFAIPAGTWHPSQVAVTLNAQFATAGAPAIAKDNGDGRLRLEVLTAGVANTITISATTVGASNFLLYEAGFALATTTGTAAGSGKTKSGSFMWLTNPKQLIWGILGKTRIYAEYKKERDALETMIYNEVASGIENTDAMVKIKNLRLTEL